MVLIFGDEQVAVDFVALLAEVFVSQTLWSAGEVCSPTPLVDGGGSPFVPLCDGGGMPFANVHESSSSGETVPSPPLVAKGSFADVQGLSSAGE